MRPPPTAGELARSPRDRVAALVMKTGARPVVDWCAELLAGSVTYDDAGRPPVTWLGGRHAAGLLARGGFEHRGQEYWPRVWAARALLYAWHPGAETAILHGLHDPAWRVREMCAKVARLRVLERAEPILTGLLDDPVSRVRIAVEAAVTELATSPAAGQARFESQ